MLLVITQRKYDRATQHSYLRSISIFPMLFSKFIRNLQVLIFYLFIQTNLLNRKKPYPICDSITSKYVWGGVLVNMTSFKKKLFKKL